MKSGIYQRREATSQKQTDRKSNIYSKDFTVTSHVCQVIMTRKETGFGKTEIAGQRGTIKKQTRICGELSKYHLD